MRELLAQTVRVTDPRTRDYGIVRDLHPQHDDLVRVEWLTGAWAGHVTDWTAAELEPLGFGVRPPARDGRCEFDTGSALGNVRVCRLPATHTVRDGETGGTHGRYCKDHARLSRYRQFGYRSDPAYALVTVEPLPGVNPWADGVRDHPQVRAEERAARVTS